MTLPYRLFTWLLRHLNPCRHRWVTVHTTTLVRPGAYVQTARVYCPGCGEELTW